VANARKTFGWRNQWGRLPGKTKWAGRRRPATRRAGFSARAATTLQTATAESYSLESGRALEFVFHLPTVSKGDWIGFGGWFACARGVAVDLIDAPERALVAQAAIPNWSKFGSLWRSDGTPTRPITLRFTATKRASVATWSFLCGRVEHEYLRGARPELLGNMWSFAPEANFYDPKAQGTISMTKGFERDGPVAEMHLKSCNRCGRLLPINIADEQIHLSFSNHCVAKHRRPCRHSGFGRITNTTRNQVLQLEYGFQLECRYCKKFEVNAAHNPQRTAAQMKEDGARRRAFEMLLEALYEGTPQLRYRSQTGGRELAEDVWKRFGGQCFKCGTGLATSRDMALDHTRPLSLLWPLDGSATALCPTHNSEKRDRPPSQFYTDDELRRLAHITGISLGELRDPSPNREALDLLGRRLEWFFGEFLETPELTKTRDGKRAGDLLVKALQKALDRYPGGAPYQLKRPHRARLNV
jgi:hypothetical protein